MCTLAAALVCVGAGIGFAPPAQADDADVQLSLTSMTPPVWQPGATLSFTGTVTNQTGRTLTGLTVVLWQSRTPITTLSELDAALTSTDVSNPTGTAVPSGTQTTQTLGPMSGGTLGAGGVASFSLSGVPELSQAGAAYLVGVQVLDANGQVLARARVVLGYAAPDQSASALVVPLTVHPSLITAAVTGDTPSRAVFQDESLADDLGGQLGQLIALASQPGVTPLIDPGLVDELMQMAGGYQVQTPTGELTDGTGQQAAAAALESINGMIARGAAYRLPYGNPSLNAMAEVPNASRILAFSALDADDPLESLPLAVLVQGAAPTTDARQLISSLKPALVISDVLNPTATLQAADGISWVATTPAVTLEDLTGPLPSFTGASGIQPPAIRNARLIVAAAQGAPTVVVVDDAATAQLATSWLTGGWQPVDLTLAVNGLKAHNLSLTSEPPAIAVPAELVARLTTIMKQATQVADLGNDAATATLTGQRLLPTALSNTWDGDWIASMAWLFDASAKLEQQFNAGDVELHVAGEWYLSSTDNRMPITVVNNMGLPVTVRVRFTSENAQRLSVPETEPLIIDAGSTASVIATPQAHGNGSVMVTAQLYTLQGTRIGSPMRVQVVTTSAGRLGWIIIVGSGIAFVVATSLRVRQVRHQRKTGTATSNTPPMENQAQ